MSNINHVCFAERGRLAAIIKEIKEMPDDDKTIDQLRGLLTFLTVRRMLKQEKNLDKFTASD